MIKKILLAIAAVVTVIALGVLFWVYLVLRGLPDVNVLKRYRPAAATEVLDRDGRPITTFSEGKFRVWVPIAELSDRVIHAVVTAEDDTFFEHQGVNYKATWDALKLDLQKRRYVRGGSTITQQMIKNVLLSKEKTIVRKLREYVLATRAEQALSKRRILEIYLNEVEWGDTIYGIEAASRYYLDKHASELTSAEAALLAGMLPNPRYYDPFKRPDKARRRQEQVLFNLQQAKLMSQEEYDAALANPVKLRTSSTRFDFGALTASGRRACYQHGLERTLVALFGEQKLYGSGMQIRTTLDRSMQDEVQQWEDGLADKPSPGDSVTVVKMEGTVRAITCATGKDAELLMRLDPPGLRRDAFQIETVSPESIPREAIIPALVSGGVPTAP